METQFISTAALARRLDIKAASIRTAVYRAGHFWGLSPRKAPSGRLLWAEGEIATLLKRAGDGVDPGRTNPASAGRAGGAR